MLTPCARLAAPQITSDYVSTIEVGGKQVLQVEPEALRLLASAAMVDIAHLLRPTHLQQLANILDDPEASSNDKFVALELVRSPLRGCPCSSAAPRLRRLSCLCPRLVRTDPHAPRTSVTRHL